MRRSDLRVEHLLQADLAGTDLEDAVWSGARVQQALLYSARMRRTDLRAADLTSANLERAVFEDTDLREADLCGVDLDRTNPSRTRLERAHYDDSVRLPKGFIADDASMVRIGD